MDLTQNSINQTPEREQKRFKKGSQNYRIPDPSLYITKIIAPENEVKKKIMAKELGEALLTQIEENKIRRQEERKRKILEDLKEDERLKKQAKSTERKIGRAKVYDSHVKYINPFKKSTKNINLSSIKTAKDEDQ